MKTVSQEIARVTGTEIKGCDKHNILYVGQCTFCRQDNRLKIYARAKVLGLGVK